MTEKYYKENAIIEAVANRISEWFDVSNTASYALIETALNDVAPENIFERKHGHWIYHENADVFEGYEVPMFECSECGEWKEYDTDFCPDCGAIIDEEME